jgi:hypothetical protein
VIKFINFRFAYSPHLGDFQRGRVVRMHLVVSSSMFMLIMTDDMGDAGPWLHHYYLCTTLTPGLRSLGLGVARRVVGLVNGSRNQA